jgi:hypothetical protein
MNFMVHEFYLQKAVPITKLISRKIFMVYFAQLCCNTSANLHSDHMSFRWFQGALYIVDAFFDFPFESFFIKRGPKNGTPCCILSVTGFIKIKVGSAPTMRRFVWIYSSWNSLLQLHHIADENCTHSSISE